MKLNLCCVLIQASDNDMDPVFTVSTRKGMNPSALTVAFFLGDSSLCILRVLTIHSLCTVMCNKSRTLIDVFLFSGGACPLKHGHINEQKLPVSAGPLWRCITVDGDPESVWPGAKPGEKLGAAFSRACFFFYLDCPLLLPTFPGHSLRHGPPKQPTQW